MSIFLKVGNQNYYLNFENIEKVLSSRSSGFKGGLIDEKETTENYDDKNKLVGKTVVTRNYHKSKEVDGFRYETLRNMIELLLTTEDENDMTNGKDLVKQPINFKLAFNTLLEYGILDIADEA